ncbi:MAG: DUF4290 domain-containing protein [Bacteroidales bacterium]|nr:DUF4290 domain-containing protein [Bacteroidales bacterium]
MAEDSCRLLYNTQRKSLKLPEYGRNVQKMVEYLRSLPDREKRNEQAWAVIRVMETVNPQVHLQENYEQKLWDHLFIIADFDLDVDSPYPKPAAEKYDTKPLPIPLAERPPKAVHYGRNIESFIDKVAEMEEGEDRDALLHTLAQNMKQQYLIWNKDVVSDETIFADIESLSDGRIRIPEGFRLGKVYQENPYPQRQNYGGRQNGHHQNHYNNQRRNQRGK